MPVTPDPKFFPVPILPPNSRLHAVQPGASQPDQDQVYTIDQSQVTNPDSGMPTPAFIQMLQQMWAKLNGTNLIIPCTATSPAPNQIVLTKMVASSAPDDPGTVATYEDYATYAFISPIDSTGSVGLQVSGLPILTVYKQNGAAPVAAADIVVDCQYLVTFADVMKNGNRGFVLR